MNQNKITALYCRLSVEDIKEDKEKKRKGKEDVWKTGGEVFNWWVEEYKRVPNGQMNLFAQHKAWGFLPLPLQIFNGGENMYELIIIWADGDKNVYPYQTEEEARQGERNMRMAFGNQVSWAGVRKSRE